MTRQKRPLDAIKYIVVHHTASNDKYSTHESLDGHIQKTNLGYHVTVDDDKGSGADGYASFRRHVPDDEVVWGAAGCNYNGWHIAIDGNSQVTPPTEDEKNTVVQVVATICKRLGWKKRDVVRIVTHNYVGLVLSSKKYVTECPGKPIINWMPELRDRVSAYLPS